MKKVLPFVILVIGLVSSIVLHELFHIVMHWGHIRAIEIFPPSGNIVQVVTDPVPAGYNVLNEELMAYGITIIVLVATMLLFARMILKRGR